MTWGTKGDTAPAAVKLAGPAKPGEDGKTPVSRGMKGADLDAWYKRQREIVLFKGAEEEDKAVVNDAEYSQDQYRAFRTLMVSAWMGCNYILVVVMSQDQVAQWFAGDPGAMSNSYLTFIFWTVAALSMVRFGGVVCYLIMRTMQASPPTKRRANNAGHKSPKKQKQTA